MKNLLVLALLGFGSLAQAQVSEFEGRVSVNSGESKNFTLLVNTYLRTDSFGDPEIGGHGFYNYMITGSVSEGMQRCNFEVLLDQDNGISQPMNEILKNKSDRSGVIKLCSGLSAEISSVKSLMLGNSQNVTLKAPGLDKAIGIGILKFEGLKTIPSPDSQDY